MHHTICSNILFLIREIRFAKGYSQEYMAYRLEISQQSYSRLENGRQDLRMSQLIEIANILDVEAAHLLKLAKSSDMKLGYRDGALLLARFEMPPAHRPPGVS